MSGVAEAKRTRSVEMLELGDLSQLSPGRAAAFPLKPFADLGCGLEAGNLGLWEQGVIALV